VKGRYDKGGLQRGREVKIKEGLENACLQRTRTGINGINELREKIVERILYGRWVE
jgi:hypothetical protein